MLSPLSWVRKFCVGTALLLTVAGCSTGSQHRGSEVDDSRSATGTPTLVPVPAPAAEEARLQSARAPKLQVASGEEVDSAEDESFVGAVAAWSILPTRHTVAEPVESQRRLVPQAPSMLDRVSQKFHNMLGGDEETVAMPAPRPVSKLQPVDLAVPESDAETRTAATNAPTALTMPAEVDETTVEASTLDAQASTVPADWQTSPVNSTPRASEPQLTEEGVELWPYRPVEVTQEPVLHATRPVSDAGSQGYAITRTEVVTESVEVEQWPYRQAAEANDVPLENGVGAATTPSQVETPGPVTYAIVPRLAERTVEPSTVPALNPLQ